MYMLEVVEAGQRKFGEVLACINTESRPYAEFYKLVILRNEPACKDAPYMTITARKDTDSNPVCFMHGHYDLLEKAALWEIKCIAS